MITLTLITLSNFHCISLIFKMFLQGWKGQAAQIFLKEKDYHNIENIPKGPYKKKGGKFEHLTKLITVGGRGVLHCSSRQIFRIKFITMLLVSGFIIYFKGWGDGVYIKWPLLKLRINIFKTFSSNKYSQMATAFIIHHSTNTKSLEKQKINIHKISRQ